ncbi:hypothetical protein HJFPF1_11336 [Paramyrothecium foliicola]|nr:hypothetical protein HJFPF1_11336 [Paramyrothecium foliicola]
MSSSSSSGHPSRRHDSSASAASHSPRIGTESSRNSMPFTFRLPFQPNPSSTSLVSSTAEGRPIPVDDTTVEHRTSALRELNNNYPSRHRYAKSTGAQSSTYSEPVIVRSYYSPVPTRPIGNTRGGLAGRSGAAIGSVTSGATSAVSRILPFANKVSTAGNGMITSMARARTKKVRGDASAETRLPPVEAFRFKSFIANIDAQGNGPDISADLDRIAEICARSRYSLSNQYEVHYAPHGSGSSFLPKISRAQDNQGPTLQAVTSDDERIIRRQRKRRSGARRSSRAMGTLETIMSSSRSSDEEKTKKKSAAEIAEEIRGRAVRKDSGESSPTNSSGSTFDESCSPEEVLPIRVLVTKKSGSLALIEGAKQHALSGDSATPRSSATGLVSEPAVPQASTSQLEIRTSREDSYRASSNDATFSNEDPLDVLKIGGAKEHDSSTEAQSPAAGLFTALSSWIPWKSHEGVTDNNKGRAEGTLRELLKTTDMKGKAVER